MKIFQSQPQFCLKFEKEKLNCVWFFFQTVLTRYEINLCVNCIVLSSVSAKRGRYHT